MKRLSQAKPDSRLRCRGVTLVEMMVTMVTSVLIMGGAMAAYIYGLKMMQFTQPKLSASDDARKAVSALMEDVRSAFDLEVGTLANGVFAHTSPNTEQIGNALRIYPSTNTNQFVIYFSDITDSTLKRTTNNTQFTTIVSGITNEFAFVAEDFKGVHLSNDVDNFVVGLTLQIYQLKYPTVGVGPGQFYDWYQLRTKATKRNIF